jgi:ribose 5-phosphate isomerase B
MGKKQIITDSDIFQAWKKGAKTIDLQENAIITPQAKDSAKVKNITFVYPVEKASGKSFSDNNSGPLTVAIGCDHGGFRIKETIKKFLIDKKINIMDLGTNSEDPCDYPDFALAVSLAVKGRRADFGIMIDGVGVASCMVANKVPGIRAACCTNELCARSSREHNNANVLTLGSKVVGEELAKSIIQAFISAKFLEGRHLKRVEKIRDIENKFSK